MNPVLKASYTFSKIDTTKVKLGKYILIAFILSFIYSFLRTILVFMDGQNQLSLILKMREYLYI